jgi:hypothetical protein
MPRITFPIPLFDPCGRRGDAMHRPAILQQPINMVLHGNYGKLGLVRNDTFVPMSERLNAPKACIQPHERY